MNPLETMIPDWLRECGVTAEIAQNVMAALCGLAALKLSAVAIRLGLRAAKSAKARMTPKDGELCRSIVEEVGSCAARWTPGGLDQLYSFLRVGRLLFRFAGDEILGIHVEAADWCVLADLTPRERKVVRKAALAAVARAKSNESQAHHARSLRLLTREPSWCQDACVQMDAGRVACDEPDEVEGDEQGPVNNCRTAKKLPPLADQLAGLPMCKRTTV